MAKEKKDNSMKRKNQINIKVSDVEYELLSKKAEDAKMTVSAYLRELFVHGAVPVSIKIVREEKTSARILELLSISANNLNQIARYFHLGGIRSEQMQEEIRECMNVMIEIRDLLKKEEIVGWQLSNT